MERSTLIQRTKRLVLIGSVFIGTAMITGCTGYVGVVTYAPPPPRAVVVVEPAPAPAPAPVVVVDGPVIVDPSVVVIDVEPDPTYRVYVYDPGFPPGAYFYGGFYYYGGYRYPHDVFINRYVVVNVREHRFADAHENRERSMVIEAQHRRDYQAHNAHGHPADAHGHPTDPHARAADPHAKPASLTAAQRGERRSTGDAH
jgi:hypothetical protein